VNGNVKRCQMSMFERRVSVPRPNFFFLKKKPWTCMSLQGQAGAYVCFFFKKKKYKQHMFRF
jgi:hypothetical protein